MRTRSAWHEALLWEPIERLRERAPGDAVFPAGRGVVLRIVLRPDGTLLFEYLRTSELREAGHAA